MNCLPVLQLNKNHSAITFDIDILQLCSKFVKTIEQMVKYSFNNTPQLSTLFEQKNKKKKKKRRETNDDKDFRLSLTTQNFEKLELKFKKSR